MLKLEHYESLNSYVPLDFTSSKDFIIAFLVASAFIILRYFLSVFPFYFYFWMNQRKPNSRYLHASSFPADQIQLEIRYSVISSFIFALAGVLMAYLWKSGLTLIYLKLDAYSYGYLMISFILIALLHEIYFYGTHRWMHQKRIFKRVHRIHHLSRNTSPWASFSFHPYEALILAAFLPLIITVLPLHPLVIITYMVFMTLTAISNHLGVELLRSPILLKHFISGTHHSLHHKKLNSNFGLYFCFMDQIFRTEYIEDKK